ncbi:MAG: hypothetical protein AW09_003832 [Candidatus Accumulibacter phosphatis]|uniref:Uncharacterized protein n=1 Tax=Candidatus Accumulibacter phosphatis TaxID=327160 RepID=A0A080LRZ6_9PROT|nr:hypothetical protein [Accumulibacter sp.]KFB71051.1 MAG: hypothetical protein AW09_003832 [Candidatus Accumulibacter phosphatis]HRF10616.1 hypothetical protein [Candidatus Accumulibacter phosphatis]
MPSIARSADIERQLLAPLEALLRDAQALLGVELDADRLEEAAGRGWSESAALPFPALNRTEPARRAIARPPAAGFSSAPLRGAVDSVQPGAPAVEQGEFPQRVVDRAEPGCLSPGALPTALQGTRFEQAFQFASSTPQSVSPQVGTDRSAGPASTRPYFNRPAPLAESFPVSGQHDAAEFPAVEWPIQPGEHPETRAARMLSGDGRQTPDAETARPAAASPHRLQPLGPQPDSHGTFAISLRPRQTPSPLGESPASSACNDAAAAPTEAHALRPDQHPQVPTAAMPSGDSHQPTDAAVTPPVASLADSSQPVNPAPDSHRSLAIPLRPRQALAPEPSFATAEAAKPPGPGNHLQTAARRLAGAVEPSLEQAYRLTQARLDTSATSASERIESPSLVRNTFNVTVALRADDASVSLDPTALADALTEVLRSSARRHGLEI